MSGYRSGHLRAADGLRLAWREYGDPLDARLPLLCLAGLTRNSVDFTDVAARLAVRRRVLCPDYRGRGRSAYAADPQTYTPAWYLNDIGQLLTLTGCHRVVVLGTSLGGILAMALGAARPTALAGAILNDIGPELDPTGIARISGYVGAAVAFPDLPAAAAALAAQFRHAFPDFAQAEWENYARRSFRALPDGGYGLDYDPALGAALKRADNAPRDLWPLFGTLRALPLLAIRGRLSDLLSEATFRRMADEHPGLAAVTVPNRGHVPLLDEPECVAAIDAFLEGIAHDDRHVHAHAG